MIFMNMAMIQWYTKKQATVEGAVFGAEFVAMKVGVETLRGVRYKLRMMGVDIDGTTYIYGDNMSVINTTSKPESMYVEEEIKFYLLSFHKGDCCNEGMSYNSRPNTE